MRAFCSLSGGKDSVFALFKARTWGIECGVAINMLDEKNERTRSHGLRSSILQKQAEALGMNVLQRSTSWESYESVFKEAVLSLKQKGIEAGIFGDIDLEEHRSWIERVAKEAGIVPILPLWGMDRKRIIEDFIDTGFRAIVCATRIEALRPYLGKEIDRGFLSVMESLSVDPCGEAGEFHTFVYDGPIFKKRLSVKKGEEIEKGGFYFLDLELLEDGCR